MLQIKKYLEKNKNPSEYNYLVKIGERLSGEKTKGEGLLVVTIVG